ncbi:MAG TPA: decaprenylphospho-beta-D-erythro-pentofuranosid-2-ulose 2-reductase [Propionibacteriaceae bacterium]|nr:decaprenylphospho-beta-D-erythro-pentofuranosid-2-ulose 2-reductase [Propionibacteriaceae bacterium]
MEFAPASILLLGGTSDIGLAIIEAYLGRRKARVVLGIRATSASREDSASRLLAAGAVDVSIVDFDAADPASHPEAIEHAFAGGPIDVAIVAFGVLGDAETNWNDQSAAVEIATVNYTGAVSVGVLLSTRLRAQGQGRIIALSSVAGEKVRRSNFVYGSTKAGMDAFYVNLATALKPSGVSVHVVRPGFVATSMTEGRASLPLSTDAPSVARDVLAGVDAGRTVIWSPRVFRPVMLALKHVPGPIFRRLPL